MPPFALPAALPVRAARDQYLAENGFTVEGYSAPTFQLKPLGIPLTLRNPPVRQRAVPLHDLHHVATGYGTDFVGEAEIGLFEIRAGCTSLFLYGINGSAALVGFLLSPRRMLRAWRRAKGTRSLYVVDRPLDELLGMSLGELRTALGIPAEGLVDEAPGHHRDAPHPA